ncbi:MAG: HlyD family efflux transporter periplasmic adaptor subunit [Chitinophagales bacterium]|nr:HlyD family efflux transporter periplasmic adaptor subunit [Chitinophagales bacterium]
MTESVYASVTIQPEGLYNVHAATPGIIEHIIVGEGDSVNADQIIAKIIALDPEINVENAVISVELARDNLKGGSSVLKSINDEIRSTKEQLLVDSVNYLRQQRLWEQNIGSKAEFESRKLKFDQSKSQLDILKKKYSRTKNELESNYKQSINALKKTQSTLSDYFIRSRMEGRLYSLLKKDGEVVGLQEPIAQIGRHSFIVEMLIDEVDVTRIHLRQKAMIALDAYEGVVFEAKVSKIYPQKNSLSQTFKVEAEFVEGPEILYAGLSGEANIIISEKEDVITIPLEYLLEGDKVKTDDGNIDVVCGMRNLEHVEIVSGLDTETEIIKP